MCQRPIFPALAGRLARHPLRTLAKSLQDPFRKLSTIDFDTSPAYGKGEGEGEGGGEPAEAIEARPEVSIEAKLWGIVEFSGLQRKYYDAEPR